MNDWKLMTVGDLCKTVSESYRRHDDEVVLVNTSDILEGIILNHKLVPNKDLKGQFKKTFKKEDILYSEIRPANKRYAFVDFENTDQYIASTKIMVLRPDKELVLPRFLYAFLTSSSVLAELQHQAETRSGTFPQITFSSEVAPMSIFLPSVEIQFRIVEMLDAIENKIRINESINDNLVEMMNAYYKALFSNINQNKCTVGDFAERIYSGGTPSTTIAEYWNGEFPWLSSGETKNRFVVSTDKCITQSGIDNSSTREAEKHDIVIASAGQGHTRGQTSMLFLNTYINQSVIAVHAQKKILPYLFWNISNRYDELRAISDSSSIRGSLTTKMISAFEIPYPSDDGINAFSALAWSVLPQIENNLQENIRLSELRDSLLPRLMSGEIDVSAIAV